MTIAALSTPQVTVDPVTALTIAGSVNKLAQTHVKLGDFELALSICSSTLKGRRRLLGKTHHSCFEALALRARIIEPQGGPSCAGVYAAMLPEQYCGCEYHI